MSTNTRTTVASLAARMDASEQEQARVNAQILGTLDVILAKFDTAAPAVTAPVAPAPAPAPKGTKPLTLKAFRAHKATKAGAKAYAGVSRKDVLEGRAPMPKGFHAPTGELKAAIKAAKA